MMLEFLDWALQQLNRAEEELRVVDEAKGKTKLDEHLARFDLMITGSLDQQAKQEIRGFLEQHRDATIISLMLCFDGYESKSGQRLDIFGRLSGPHDAAEAHTWLLGMVYIHRECLRRLASPPGTPQNWPALDDFKSRLIVGIKNLIQRVQEDEELKKRIPALLSEFEGGDGPEGTE